MLPALLYMKTSPINLSPSLGAMSSDALISVTLSLEARKEQVHETNSSKISVLGNCKLFS